MTERLINILERIAVGMRREYYLSQH